MPCLIVRGERQVVSAARRVLAVLGANAALELAQRGLGCGERAEGGGRGLRVLSIDGGGVKGIVAIRVLAALERRLGRPLHEVFDLVVGCSAGGIVACGLGHKMDTAQIEQGYVDVLGKAFSVAREVRDKSEQLHVLADGNAESMESEERPGERSGEREGMSWWQKVVASGSNMKRVVLSGCKYDHKPLCAGLRDQFGPAVDQLMVDANVESGGLKIAVASTITSHRPIGPYLFRSYQLPPGAPDLFPGGCHYSWLEAMRASSAAPYFFEEFACRGERFQDGDCRACPRCLALHAARPELCFDLRWARPGGAGAICANNPAILALHDAQRLWPGRDIDLVLSVGTGQAPVQRRDERQASLLRTFGEFMVESATATDRVAEALAVFAPLVPHTSFFRLQERLPIPPALHVQES